MTAQERNKYELQLVQLKAKFIKIGILKMPTKDINGLMPKHLKGVDAVKWAAKASNVWNGRSTEFEYYLPIFEQVYNKLK